MPTDPSLRAEAPISPRSDLAGSLGWIAFGVAVLIGSVTMDRLEEQHINPYTAPGLLPGLLGAMMILLGSVLALRSLGRGALRFTVAPTSADQREEWRRVGIVLGLCATYCVVLIGHGLPFWLASAVYVTGSILILQRISRDAQTRLMSLRTVVKALVIGLSAAVITHLVFQDLFLVRLP
ncbi:MAG TPA: tripartite tricarboxylate transporter TctB family protein [Burkholderiaceae bacterium]|nr:tripartite tricarboxylate transporter TctB family protein [Burkholderiaceae bacterium]